ncbi:MAG: hypothetical protein QOE57_809 [Acidimicrobiaceae bacterium]|nr:hypothetical protein [Acidimicrobiaceae bacterium]
MIRAWVFGQTAVLVFDWYEPDPAGPEHGVRIEVRLLRDCGARGSPSAAQEIVIDRPLFRADLFDLVAGEPGNFARAHYHPSFEGGEGGVGGVGVGVEPSEREWDGELSAHPFAWLAGRLSDLEAIVAAADAAGTAGAVDPEGLAADAAALREVVAEVVAAAETVMARVRSRAAG